jgi:hypothetical protein
MERGCNQVFGMHVPFARGVLFLRCQFLLSRCFAKGLMHAESQSRRVGEPLQNDESPQFVACSKDQRAWW